MYFVTRAVDYDFKGMLWNNSEEDRIIQVLAEYLAECHGKVIADQDLTLATAQLTAWFMHARYGDVFELQASSGLFRVIKTYKAHRQVSQSLLTKE